MGQSFYTENSTRTEHFEWGDTPKTFWFVLSLKGELLLETRGPTVISLVFIIGATNLALGFCLAVALERPIDIPCPRLPPLRLPSFRRKPTAEASSSAAPAAVNPGATKQAEVEPIELPEGWAEALGAFAKTVRSVFEALLRIAKTKLHADAKRLVRFDQMAADGNQEFPLKAVQLIYADCRASLSAWQAGMSKFADRDQHKEQFAEIEQWFQQLGAQIQEIDESAQTALQTSEFDRSALREQLQQAFAAIGRIRFRCEDAFARLLRIENRIDDVDPADLTDPISGLLNRLGIEAAVKEWVANDPERLRMVSVTLVDLDHCTKLNAQHGLAVTNGVLSGLQLLLKDLVRKDRGFDRVSIDGQSAVMLMGDTALRNATSGTERIRQNIAATTFMSGEVPIACTVSCAVGEWLPTETIDELIARLRQGLLMAKTAGRNCTTVCTPEETRVAQSARTQIAPRELAVSL